MGDPCPGCVEEVEGGAIAKGSGGISSGTCRDKSAGVEVKNLAGDLPLPHPLRLHRSPVASAAYLHTIKLIGE